MSKSNLRILVTGATGNIGKELIKKLSAQQISFRVMVRSQKGSEAVAALAGAEVAVGDFNDSKSTGDA